MVYIYTWCVLLLLCGSLFFIAWFVWVNRQDILVAWNKMNSFERYSLFVGLLLYVIVIPLIKNNPGMNKYVVGVFEDIYKALADALFILGILAFLKNSHKS